MSNDKVIALSGTEETKDLLTDIAREGARRMLQVALEEEVVEFIKLHSREQLADGRQRVVRNGHLPAREIQTGIGNLTVRAPRARDRGDGSVRFTSEILPPYLRRAKSVEELLPWLYLKGISTNDFKEALTALAWAGCRRIISVDYWTAQGTVGAGLHKLAQGRPFEEAICVLVGRWDLLRYSGRG